MATEAERRPATLEIPMRRWGTSQLQISFLLALVLSVVGRQADGATGERARRQRQAVIAIEDMGGEVQYADSSPIAAKFGLPPDWTADVVTVQITGGKLTDATLNHLEALPRLESLYLEKSTIYPQLLARLDRLPHLEELLIGGTFLEDEDLVYLEGLQRLRSLMVQGRGVTDVGLARLQGLKNLEQLSLNFTRVTRTAVKRFEKALPRCKVYHLSRLQRVRDGKCY